MEAKVLAPVRFLMVSGHARDATALQDEAAVLSGRSANASACHSPFYLFESVFFWGLRFKSQTPDSKTPVGMLLLENFFL